MLTVLQALADPVRLEIVRQLHRNMTGSCTTLQLGIAKSTTSHHLRVLREAGLIRTRLEGVNRTSELRYDDLQQRFPGFLPSVLTGQAGLQDATQVREQS